MINIRIFFNNILSNDADSEYSVFYANYNGQLFGTSNAKIVEDSNMELQSGLLNGRREVSFLHDNSTSFDIIIVAIGLNDAKYVIMKATVIQDDEELIIFVNSEKETITYV